MILMNKLLIETFYQEQLMSFLYSMLKVKKHT